MSKSATVLKTHQEAPQPQISASAMEDAIQLVKALETPYLRDLQKLIANEISTRMDQERHEAVFKVQKIASELGMSLEELIASTSRKSPVAKTAKVVRNPAAVKYRHPQDPELTWTGRGMAPKWFKDFQAANGSVDALLVAKG